METMVNIVPIVYFQLIRFFGDNDILGVCPITCVLFILETFLRFTVRNHNNNAAFLY